MRLDGRAGDRGHVVAGSWAAAWLQGGTRAMVLVALAFAAALALLVAMSPRQALAGGDYGDCGVGIHATYDGDRTELTIWCEPGTSGFTGAIYDYDDPTTAPWYADGGTIETIVVGEGVTRIGSGAFASLTNAYQVVLPRSLQSVGSECVAAGARLTSEGCVYYVGTDAQFVGLLNGLASGNGGAGYGRLVQEPLVVTLDLGTCAMTVPLKSSGETATPGNMLGLSNTLQALAGAGVIGYQPSSQAYDLDNDGTLDVEVTYGALCASDSSNLLGTTKTLTYPDSLRDSAYNQGVFYSTVELTLGQPPAAPIDISGAAVSGLGSLEYTGGPLLVPPTVTMGSTLLAEGNDYSVSVAPGSNVEVGTVTMTISGINGYTGTKDATFDITHLPLTSLLPDLDPSGWYLTEGPGSFPGLHTYFLDYTIAKGLMTGYKGPGGVVTGFGPEDPVTRAQIVIVLYRMANPGSLATTDPAYYDATNTTGLSDVEAGTYYTAAVNWAVSNNVVTGYQDPDGVYRTFGPDDPVTREQLATMIYRFCVNYLGLPSTSASLAGFSDAGQVDGWAQDGVSYCVGRGIIGGYGGTTLLGPDDQANRTQISKIVALVGHDLLGL